MSKAFQQITLDFGLEPPAPPAVSEPDQPALVAPQSIEPPVKNAEAPIKIDLTTDSTAVSIRRKPGRKLKEKVWKSATPGKRGRKSLKEIAAEADLVEIPSDEELFTKQYYSIGDVANMFRMNPSLIRTWSNEFESMLKPRKNRKGDRFYRPEDVKFLHLIYHLVRVRKFTLEGAREHLKGQKKKMESQFQVIQKLQQLKAFLLELKANI